jgi:glycosyltransferase involved in cell wall biosynthesis
LSQAARLRKGSGMNRPARPRSLAGATILQLVPALVDDPAAHAAVDIARTLVQSGARAIVAGDGGPLVSELHTFGAEWVPMNLASYNPFRLRANARFLAQLIAAERVDIVHAHHAAAAWSALSATHKQPFFLVTSFGDRLPKTGWPATQLGRSLARGTRVIAPSTYISLSMMTRYGIPADRITVIPRAIDTDTFNPAAISGDLIAALRRVWGILPDMRVVVVAGRIAPWNGQMTALEAARLIVANRRDINFLFVGDDRAQPRYAASLRRRAATHAIETLCRFVGHCADMPAAFAAADIVVVPAMRLPLSGRLAAQAQAIGRAVVTTAVGMLPENVLAPPRMRDELRTGWVVRPGRPGELAEALTSALALDRTAADALGARAREFAEFMFSPQSVAASIRDVYTSLLSRDR